MPVAVSRNAINWNIVNKNFRPGTPVKEMLARKIVGLGKHLVHFPPETLHLQVMLEKRAKNGTYVVRLTLRLPSNILHAEKSDGNLLRAIDSSTAALEHEVESLKAELRGDYRWKRPAWRAKLRAQKVLVFSEPMEAGSGPQTHADMVADLLAAHDRHLLAHTRRAVRMAELNGELPAGAVDARDIVDEAARICLAHPEKKPDALTYEQWSYRLIRAELARQRRQLAEEQALRAEPAGNKPPAPSADEAEGYDAEQPLDLITRALEPEEALPEERVADPSVVPPDATFGGRDLVEWLQEEVKRWPASEREVFELYYLVGLDADDVAMVCERSQEDVEGLLAKVQRRLRDLLRRASDPNA